MMFHVGTVWPGVIRNVHEINKYTDDVLQKSFPRGVERPKVMIIPKFQIQKVISKRAMAMNILCGICKEALNVLNSKGEGGTNASALPCGHVFHTSCVNQWFDASGSVRSATCPQCRAALVKSKSLTLYWDVVPVEIDDDPACIKAVSECLKRENQDLKERLQTARDKAYQFEHINQSLRENVLSLENKLSAASLNERILTVTRQKLNSKTKENENLKDEVERLRRKNESMRACNTVMNGSFENGEEREVFQLMEKEQIAMLCMNFRKDGKNLEKRYESTRQDLMKTQSENRELKKNLDGFVVELSILTNVLDAYKRKANKIPRLNGEDGCKDHAKSTSAPDLSSRPVLGSPVDWTDDSPPCKVPNVSTPSAPPLRSQNVSLGAIRKTCGRDRLTVAGPSRVTSHEARDRTAHLFSPTRTRTRTPLLNEEFYDGLGGHSRLDDFPKPKITTDRKILKAKRPAW